MMMMISFLLGGFSLEKDHDVQYFTTDILVGIYFILFFFSSPGMNVLGEVM